MAKPKPPYQADYKDLVLSLRNARLAARREQAWVAEQLGVSQSFVSKYEGGERTLNLIDFVAICGVLGLSPAEEITKIKVRQRLK